MQVQDCPDDETAITGVIAENSKIIFEFFGASQAAALIISREGTNGEHLRSTESLKIEATQAADAPYTDTSKTAAIKSYQSSTAVNADWAEESIQ